MKPPWMEVGKCTTSVGTIIAYRENLNKNRWEYVALFVTRRKNYACGYVTPHGHYRTRTFKTIAEAVNYYESELRDDDLNRIRA